MTETPEAKWPAHEAGHYFSAVGEVHGDFEADPQVFIGWFGPHNAYLL
jgi:hypothetical protein